VSALLSVRNLSKAFPARRGFLGRRAMFAAVSDVSFDIAAGETLGLVGESGSGKSTIGRAVTMLVPPTAGSVEFEGRQIAHLSSRDLQPIRRAMQIIFQDPYSALNPRMRVGDFVAEPLVIHGVLPDRRERADYVAELFRKVGLDPNFIRRYPHEFSGGQRQRICIARAIALKPKFIVADEPIAALDVSIQAQVVNLLQDLQSEFGFSYLFISHDLSMIRHICHRVAVLYRGRIVEFATATALFADPRHPYTRILLSAIPVPDPKIERTRVRLLMRPDVEYGEADSRLVEIAPGHWLAARHAQAA
jgi:ABC-type oligopeptide transport system ATPase subunit